jgi:hypothetical protein
MEQESERTRLLRITREAELYLASAKLWLEELEVMVKGCSDVTERRKLANVLEQDRVRFSQMMADTVIFKAAHGIFTDPPVDTKRIK